VVFPREQKGGRGFHLRPQVPRKTALPEIGAMRLGDFTRRGSPIPSMGVGKGLGGRGEGQGFATPGPSPKNLFQPPAQAPVRGAPSLSLPPRGPLPYTGWVMAESFQELGPTGRVKVQYSSNFTGSVLLPSSTSPVRSSTI